MSAELFYPLRCSHVCPSSLKQERSGGYHFDPAKIALPLSLSRFALRAGLVPLRQIFVSRCHDGRFAPVERSKDEQGTLALYFAVSTRDRQNRTTGSIYKRSLMFRTRAHEIRQFPLTRLERTLAQRAPKEFVA